MHGLPSSYECFIVCPVDLGNYNEYYMRTMTAVRLGGYYILYYPSTTHVSNQK